MQSAVTMQAYHLSNCQANVSPSASVSLDAWIAITTGHDPDQRGPSTQTTHVGAECSLVVKSCGLKLTKLRGPGPPCVS